MSVSVLYLTKIECPGVRVPLRDPVRVGPDPHEPHRLRVHHHRPRRGEVHHRAGPLHQDQGQ